MDKNDLLVNTMIQFLKAANIQIHTDTLPHKIKALYTCAMISKFTLNKQQTVVYLSLPALYVIATITKVTGHLSK